MSDAAETLPADTIALGAHGELHLPSWLREVLGWKEGEPLRARVIAGGSLQIEPLGEGIRKARGMLRSHSGGRSLVDELIAERRHEGTRE